MARMEDRFMQWLRDAHAMEEQAERMLAGEARRMKDYPEIKAQLERHLDETKRQAERLRGCIRRHNGGPSVVKDTMAKVLGAVQGVSGALVGDEVVKASLANYTFEQMEIASYKILIAAADKLGDHETKQVCEENLREEEEMARWLDEHLYSVTQQYLAREERPEPAVRH